MANFKKKPTKNELGSAIVEVNNRVTDLTNIVHNLDNVLGMYIRMENKLDKFNKYLEKSMEEIKNDTKTNGESDVKDISTDSKDEGSRSKRVRKKKK